MSDVSALFRLLADEHRRYLLFALCDVDTLHVPEDLGTRGQVRPDRSGAGGVPDGTQREPTDHRVRIELRHNHLPKLEEAGLVEWDRETGTVSRGPEFEAVEPALRLLARNGELFPGSLP
jgi:hypothetical protein